MAEAIFSSHQLNQIHEGNYGNHHHHHLKGFATSDHDHVLSSLGGEGNNKHDHPNITTPWGISDQDHLQDLSTPLYSIFGRMTENKEQLPPPSAPPNAAASSNLWMQNAVQLQQNRLNPMIQQPIYNNPFDTAPAPAPAHNNSNNKDTEDITLHQNLLLETIGKPLKEKPNSLTLASLELLTNYGKGMIKNIDPILGINLTGANDHQMSQQPREPNKLSLAEIVRVAGEKYVQFSIQKDESFSIFMNNYSTATPELSAEETADVELIQLLLAAAESVGHHQFDIASLLISRCQWVASDSGNAVQRIVFYFAESLQRRMDMETGKTTLERMNERTAYAKRLEVDFNLSFLACHQVIPFNQTMQFASVQAILDSVKTANKLHLVDLHIRSGIQWTVLMQALAERDELPKLKISAMATMNEQHMEETGKRLQSFAKSMNLDFTYNIVFVSEIKQLREDMFKKETDEVVAVYAPIILRTMIPYPDILGHLMRVVRKLRPVVLVVTEVEANHNSPSFVNRFTESLFFYGAFFDCMEDCMERDNQHRKIVEGVYLGEGIRNMVGSEGDKRCTRNVNLEVWREFFAWCGMVESELSDYALRQANMVISKFPKAVSSCTITNNGKGIVIKWKGTPIHSLTVWKFL